MVCLPIVSEWMTIMRSSRVLQSACWTPALPEALASPSATS
jgi:hypothetical protein